MSPDHQPKVKQAPYLWLSPPGHSAFETGECDDLGAIYEQGQGYHALWAARLTIQSVVAWSEWKQFVATLHSPPEEAAPPDEQYALALRLDQQGSYLIGRSFASEPETALAAALELFEMCRGLLPEGIEIVPAIATAQFEDYSGFSLKQRQNADLPDWHFAELVRREENLELEGTGAELYRLYPFHPSNLGWQPIARALGAGQSLLISIHPSWLYRSEQAGLMELEHRFAQLLTTEDLLLRRQAEAGLQTYRAMLSRISRGFIVRIYLLSEGRKLPRWLMQAGGAALSEEHWDDPAYAKLGLSGSGGVAGYTCLPDTSLGQAERQVALRNLLLLEQEFWGESVAPPRYERLRYLCGLWEAAALFRPSGIYPSDLNMKQALPERFRAKEEQP